MADVLATDVRCSVGWLFQEEGGLATVSDGSRVDYDQTMEDGTATDQSDKIWHAQRTLAGGSTDQFDLTSLSSQLFGDTLTIGLARVKVLFVVNTSTIVGEQLIIKPGAVNPWTAPFGGVTDLVRVPSDSCTLLTNRKDGWSVSAGGSESLAVENPNAGSVTYKIVIVGASS